MGKGREKRGERKNKYGKREEIGGEGEREK